MARIIPLLALVSTTLAQAQQPAISGYEYWFDQDHASRTYVPVPQAAAVHLPAEPLNTAGLSIGRHTAHLRFMDLGPGGVVRWSSVVDRSVTRYHDGPWLIVAVRYWVGTPVDDSNPLVRVKWLDQPQQEIDIQNEALDLCGYPMGNQSLKLQLLDNHGQWSSVVTRSVNILPAGAPNAVSSITPSGPLCPGSTVVYTAAHAVVAPNGTPTSFTWSVPPGYTVVSGQGTLTASITMGADPGTITVTASNACGDVAADFPVAPVQPFQLTGISGPAAVCSGDSATYNTQSFSGSYQWTAPPGWSFSPPTPTGSSATAIAGAGAVAGAITVQVVNVCGEPSNTVDLPVSPVALPLLGGIGGPNEICSGEPTLFTADNIPGTYTWNAPPGWSFVPPSPTGPTATVVPGPGAAPGFITVYVTAFCPGDTVQHPVSAVVPFVLASLSGADTVCTDSAAVFTVSPAVNGNHLWSAPNGWSFDPPNPSGSSATVIPGPGAVAGDITVVASNSCGEFSNTLVLPVMPAVAVSLSSVTGPDTVCVEGSATYGTDVAAGTYVWTAPTGWVFDPPAPTGPLATVIPGPGAANGSISVQLYNGCLSDPIALAVIPVADALIGAMSGTMATGQNGTVDVMVTAPDADGFTWSLPPGWMWNESGVDTLDATAYLYAAADTGLFQVCVVSYTGTGCTDTACWTVQVDLNVGVAGPGSSPRMRAWPDPSNGIFVIDGLPTGPLRAVVHDAAGAVVRTLTFIERTVELDLSDLAAGSYLLSCVEPTGAVHQVRLLIHR